MIASLKASGLTILLIEHKLDMVMRLSDRVLAMDEGRRIAMGAPAEVRDHPEVVLAYLGHRAALERRRKRGRGMSASPLLELAGVDSYYGLIQVHFDLSIAVPTGQIVCLLGGNASGKSTAMKVILGLREAAKRVGCASPERTSPAFDAADRPPRHRLGSRGAAPVPGDDGAREPADGRLSAQRSRRVAEDLTALLDRFPRLGERLAQRAGTLSGGEQQMVAMARALMSRPRLICMDEPTMGLSPLFVDRVLELISEINRDGVSVFMVEQNASQALAVADYGYVLQTGHIALSGPARTLLDDPRIRDAYLGKAAA